MRLSSLGSPAGAFALFLLASLFPGVGVARSEPGGSAPEALSNPSFAVRRERLDNGLRLILSVDRTTPSIAVDVLYDVGSRDEKRGDAARTPVLRRTCVPMVRFATGLSG